MFITVEYGEAETLLINPNCSAKVFIDFLREKCNVKETAVVDLTDENATLAELYAKDPQENLLQYFTQRGTYILCDVEKYEDSEDIKKITPMLNEWEKKYSMLERKLKHRDKKNKLQMASAVLEISKQNELLENPTSRLSIKKSDKLASSRTNATDRVLSRTGKKGSVSEKDRISEVSSEGSDSPGLLAPPTNKKARSRRKSKNKV